MAVNRITMRQWTKGLWLNGGPDDIPDGAVRRGDCLSPIRTESLRSRWGSIQLIPAINALSIYKFAQHRYLNDALGNLYRDASIIQTAFGQSRLDFAEMPPQVGDPDYLFIAGGTTLIKVDTAGNVTNWGIAPPPDGFTAAATAIKQKQMLSFDTDAANWTGVNCTLSDDASNKQEGASSLKAVLTGVTVSHTLTRNPLPTNPTDFTTFTGGASSTDQDVVQMWVMIDNPTGVSSIQIDIDLGTNFVTDWYSINIPVNNAPIPQNQLGIGGFLNTPVSELNFLGVQTGTAANITPSAVGSVPSLGQINSASGVPGLLQTINQSFIQASANTWTKVSVAKAQFTKVGTNAAKTWANCSAMRITINGGNATLWFDDCSLRGGAGMQGTYKYQVTFYNSVTGSESNPNPTPVTISNINRTGVTLSGLPISADPQVTGRRIYRTLGNGGTFFLAATINDNSSTTFVDAVADFSWLAGGTATVLQSVQLNFDNVRPATYGVTRCEGPFQGCMFLCGDPSHPGRVYYSAPGRPEGVQNFIDITFDDDPIQNLVLFNGNLFAFSRGGVFQIMSVVAPDNQSIVFTYNQVQGAPGTMHPFSIVVGPEEIVYTANEGLIKFDGTFAFPFGMDALQILFRGENVENYVAFQPIVGDYGREEFIFSDAASETLAINRTTGAWRSLGIVLNSILFETDTQNFTAALNGNIVNLEVPGVITDNGAAMNYNVQTRDSLLSLDMQPVLRMLIIDANLNGNILTPYLMLDGQPVALPNIDGTGRQRYEFAVALPCQFVGLRLVGVIQALVEIFSIQFEPVVGGPPDEQVKPDAPDASI